ncbi:MAG: O-antigen ligase family protein [Chloroflexi bacterium]|nr:O-antigen ligase family protein [Chloroflexota bacterium]
MALGLAVALLPPRVVGVTLAGGILLMLALRNSRWALAIAALVMPFGALGWTSAEATGLGYVDGVAIIAIVAWLAAQLARRRRQSHLSGWAWPVVLFLAANVAATVGVVDLPVALKEWLRWGEVLGIFVVTADVARTEDDRWHILTPLLIAGVVQALLGFAQFALQLGPPSFRVGPFLRAFGTFGQPNPYAGYLETVFPVALALTLFGWPRPSPPQSSPQPSPTGRGLLSLGRGSNWRWRLAAVTAALTAVALAMSMSRGGWLGLASGAVVGTLLLGRFPGRLGPALRLGVFISVLGGLLAAFGLLPTTVTARLASIVGSFGVFDARGVVPTAANWAVVERVAHWQSAAEMFLAQPLLGVGPGHYAVVYRAYAILPFWRDSLGHAHNIYLNVAAETGVVGLVGYLAMVGSWFLLVIRARRRLAAGAAGERAFVVGVGATLTALAVHNAFDNLYVHGMNVQVALLLGLVAGLGASRPGGGRHGGLPLRPYPSATGVRPSSPSRRS